NLAHTAEDGDSVPALLPVPQHVVAERADGLFREFLVWRFQFLEARNVRLVFLQPAQQNRQPAIDAVDVVGGDLHRQASSNTCSSAVGLSSCSNWSRVHWSGRLSSRQRRKVVPWRKRPPVTL